MNSKQKRILVYTLGILASLVLVLGVAAVLVLRSEWFREQVRTRLVTEVEKASGGTVEIGRFDFDWSGLTATVKPFVLRGTEPRNQPPLFRAESLQVGLKIISALKRDVDIASLIIDRPAVNLIIDKDGKTNIPEPKLPRPKSEKDPIEQLLDLAVQEFAIRNGTLRVAEQTTPIDLRGQDLNAKFLYDFSGPRYQGDITMRQLQVTTPAINPLAVDVALSAVLEKGKVDITKGRLGMEKSNIAFSGTFLDFNNPRLNANVNARLDVAELSPVLKLDAPGRGVVTLEGRTTYNSGEGFVFQTQLAGDGLYLKQKDLNVQGHVSLQGQGSYRSPDGLAVQAKLAGRDLSLRQGALAARGNISLDGEGSYKDAKDYAFAGRLSGERLAVRQGTTSVANARLASQVQATQNGLALKNLRLAALGGSFNGEASLKEYRDYQVDGRLANFSIQQVASLAGSKGVPYSGLVSGPIKVAGTLADTRQGSLRADVRLTIAPQKGGVPLQGNIDAGFDQRTGAIRLGDSALVLPSSRLNVAGTVGQTLRVTLDSRDLNDFLPAVNFGSTQPMKELPVALRDGSVRFDGTVVGNVNDPRLSGRLSAANLVAQNQLIDRIAADVTAAKTGAQITNLSVTQNGLALAGDASIGLQNWKPVDSSPVAARITLRNADIEKLLAQTNPAPPSVVTPPAPAGPPALAGTLNADISVQGTYADPRGSGSVVLNNARVSGEPLDQVQANLQYANNTLDLTNATIRRGGATLSAVAQYRHQPKDYKNGNARFTVSTNTVSIAELAQLRRLPRQVAGQVVLRAEGEASVTNGTAALTRLDGNINANNLALEGRPVGNLVVQAQTQGNQLNVTTTGDLRGTTLRGGAQVQLTGDYAGQGNVQLSTLEFATIKDLLVTLGMPQDLPVDGTIAGRASFSGPLNRPDALQARLELTQLEIRPSPEQRRRLSAQNLALRNAEPVVVELNGRTINVRSARFTGRDTNLDLSGTASLDPNTQWNLRARGELNLALVREFNSDIESSGRTALDATVRGTLQNPQVNGQLTLREANLNMEGLPLGIENANGVITFDRNRATITKLAAQSGGGTLALTGFVGFGGGSLDARLQAEATDVRIRTEGVSVTVSSNLNLAGTTERSQVTGSVIIRKAGLTPRTDVGGLLASSAAPVATPSTPNEFLRNMNIDIAVSSVPNLQFTTTLTSNVQAEVDLRLRGTPVKPAVLGRVLVNQGDVNFFGNKYTINRGQIGFFNPTRIEPVLDLDLQTEARGTTVTINFNGPVTKLNVSYRSDPPLQSNEIISLLALGRAPSSNPALASSQTVSDQSIFQTGANTLIGQAVASPVSNRLQRFFGISKLKIDPQFTGVDLRPDARLTLEQSVSRDITVTIITNLTNAQQQIVRLQWDLSRTLSVVAVRDENGIFGMDFQYRKRFK